MNYAIYGTNRVAKDFLYIFDQLTVVYFIDDSAAQEYFLGYRVKTLEEALNDQSYSKIILCDFDKREKEEKLKKKRMVRGKDYLYEEDFFSGLDEIEVPENRDILVWGTGNMAKLFLEQDIPYKVKALIDSYKSQEEFMGLPVLRPDQILDWTNLFVIIAVTKDTGIRQILLSKGLSENRDFIGYQKVTGMPSRLLRRTIFDRSYYELKCNTMLNHLEIFSEGNTRCCCTTFVKQNLDNIFEKNSHELWHSDLHKILCLSTENRTFSFCDKTMCPLFAEKSKAEPGGLEDPYHVMSKEPKVLSLGHDPSCNLSCGTCRKETYIAKGQDLEKIKRITEKIRKDYLPACDFLILAGDGEVFASQAYREIYESDRCNPAYIRLLSNGTLFTPRNWERFVKGKTGRIMLTVSVDAATKETYERIRRNGNFDQLQRNMEFAAGLRKNGFLKYFRMNFVVQRENYQEMIPFVKWGLQLGVDEIFFTKILNWGTYTPEEFEKISMMEADGITPKQELKEVLENPVMRSSIVDLGTIRYSHKKDIIDVVENYYMWELEKRGGKIFTHYEKENLNL